MAQSFLYQPILNSPYRGPARVWELDDDGLLSNRILKLRRRSDLISAMPGTRRRLTTMLDQGFGGWTFEGGSRHDFVKHPSAQARSLRTTNLLIAVGKLAGAPIATLLD